MTMAESDNRNDLQAITSIIMKWENDRGGVNGNDRDYYEKQMTVVNGGNAIITIDMMMMMMTMISDDKRWR